MITDEYEIYRGKYENIMGNGNKDITKGKHAGYFKDGWHEIAFEEDLVTGNSISNNANSCFRLAAPVTRSGRTVRSALNYRLTG